MLILQMDIRSASKWTQSVNNSEIVLQTLVSNVQKLLVLVLALLQDMILL